MNNYILFNGSCLNHFAFVHELVSGIGVAAGNGSLSHLLAAKSRLHVSIEPPTGHVRLCKSLLRLAHPHLAGSQAILDGISKLDEDFFHCILPAVTLNASCAPALKV